MSSGACGKPRRFRAAAEAGGKRAGRCRRRRRPGRSGGGWGRPVTATRVRPGTAFAERAGPRWAAAGAAPGGQVNPPRGPPFAPPGGDPSALGGCSGARRFLAPSARATALNTERIKRKISACGRSERSSRVVWLFFCFFFPGCCLFCARQIAVIVRTCSSGQEN